MERWSGKVAVVTGASSGIGTAIAEALVHHGMVVVGMARREDRIRQLAGKLQQDKERGKLYAVKADVSKEEDVVAAFEWVLKELGGMDVLVNSAGFYSRATVLEGTVDEWRSILDVNVIGTVITTREYLKHMIAHKKEQGHIFMINSIRSYLVDRECPAYCASKQALAAVIKCLRSDLAHDKSKIKVTAINPGSTRSELVDRTIEKGLFDRTPVIEAQDVAKVLVNALAAPPVTQICEIIMNPIPTKDDVY